MAIDFGAKQEVTKEDQRLLMIGRIHLRLIGACFELDTAISECNEHELPGGLINELTNALIAANSALKLTRPAG
jgi:hypothetical protein